MKNFKTLILVTIILLSNSCSSDRKIWTSKDIWYKPSHLNNYSTLSKVEDSLVQIISLEKLSNAEKLLKDSLVVKLSKEQTLYFLSDSTEKINLDKYLVRSVYLKHFSKGYSVYRSKDTLFIFHGSLGKEAVPMKHHALIVELPFYPKEIFTECYMDE